VSIAAIGGLLVRAILCSIRSWRTPNGKARQLIHENPTPVVVEDLLLIWSATEAEEWINRICFLPL